jgi:beta-carotene 3-hydroxylase
VTALALVVVSFAAMEGVTYAAHRWLMHGPGMGWHQSHHSARAGRFERNDLFPVCFSAVGIALFALGTTVARPLLWVAIGVTAYGAAYLLVHDVVIHRRLGVRVGGGRYLRWLRTAHAAHHRTGAEPYGMLLPVVPRERRASTRSARSRL